MKFTDDEIRIMKKGGVNVFDTSIDVLDLSDEVEVDISEKVPDYLMAHCIIDAPNGEETVNDEGLICESIMDKLGEV